MSACHSCQRRTFERQPSFGFKKAHSTIAEFTTPASIYQYTSGSIQISKNQVSLRNLGIKLNIDLRSETPQRLSRSPSLDRQAQSMNAVKNTMSKALSHAKIVPHQSAARGHSIYGWLDSYHTFSFGDFDDPRFSHFGSLQVLNEDRVKANSGFPTHPHRDFEIFSW